MVEFYLLTFPRFPLRKKEHKSYLGKNRTHDFRTSRCAAYLLDHSGDVDTAYSIQYTVYDMLLTTLLRYSKQPVAPVVQLITSKLSDVGT